MPIVSAARFRSRAITFSRKYRLSSARRERDHQRIAADVLSRATNTYPRRRKLIYFSRHSIRVYHSRHDRERSRDITGHTLCL